MIRKLLCWLDDIKYCNYRYELKNYFKYLIHKFGVHDYTYQDGSKIRCRRCGKVKND